MESSKIRQKVIEELLKMGFNFRHVGTTYILESIEIIYNSKDPKIVEAIEKNIYSEIAKKYDKKVSTIKSDIIKATESMYEQSLIQKKKIDIYYNLYPKMTPKTVINTIILKIAE